MLWLLLKSMTYINKYKFFSPIKLKDILQHNYDEYKQFYVSTTQIKLIICKQNAKPCIWPEWRHTKRYSFSKPTKYIHNIWFLTTAGHVRGRDDKLHLLTWNHTTKESAVLIWSTEDLFNAILWRYWTSLYRVCSSHISLLLTTVALWSSSTF